MIQSPKPSLALDESRESASGRSEALLTFRLGSILLGLPVEQVQEVCDLVEASPVPLSPSHVRGVMPLRGEAVPLVDLHDFLGIPEDRSDADLERPPRAVVVRTEGMTVALTSDRVLGVEHVPLLDLGPVRIHRGSRLEAYLTAECDRPSSVLARLNLSALLAGARVEL